MAEVTGGVARLAVRAAGSAADSVFGNPDIRARILLIRGSIMATGWWHTKPERCRGCTFERKGGLEGGTPIKWLETYTHDRWLCDTHRQTYQAWPALFDAGDWIWKVPRGPARDTWCRLWPEVGPRSDMEECQLRGGK